MSGANPDLPILDELGAEFSALVDAEFDAPPQRPRARLPQQPPRPRRRQAHRVARRSVVMVVLLCLVGGVALAARFGAGGDQPAHTSPTVLGKSASAGWQLSAYRDRGRLCVLFMAGDEPTSSCGPELGRDELWASSAAANSGRFVFGLTGPRVGAVAVRVGATRAGASTSAVADPEAAEAAGVNASTRWFVVPVQSTDLDARLAPAHALPLDDSREWLGPAYVDCSLGVVGAACQRRIKANAARAGD
jgi:hypothetical protein